MTGRLLFLAAAISALLVAAIFGFLAWFTLPVFQGDMLGSILTWHWQLDQGQFGILPMVVGSLALALSALFLAFPAAICLCAFVHGIGPTRLARPLLSLIRFMTSIPTVVYGLTSVFLLVPLVRSAFEGSGFSWLAAALTLSFLVLPTIVLLLDNQFQLTQERIGLSAQALGMRSVQQFIQLTLPLSRRGLAIAATLGFGRAIGDTLIPLMLAGNAAQVPGSVFDSIRTLTAHIALVISTDSQSAAYHSLFLSGLILFLISLLVNIGLRRLREPDHG